MRKSQTLKQIIVNDHHDLIIDDNDDFIVSS